MKANKNTGLATCLVSMGLLTTSCRSPQNVTLPLGSGIDSIKVEVSRPATSHAILLDQRQIATVSRNGKAERTLTALETNKLKALAEQLFIKKSDSVILSEKKAYGRTSQPILRVTLYIQGKSMTTRYDMGDEDNSMTQGTTKRIRYT